MEQNDKKILEQEIWKNVSCGISDWIGNGSGGMMWCLVRMRECLEQDNVDKDRLKKLIGEMSLYLCQLENLASYANDQLSLCQGKSLAKRELAAHPIITDAFDEALQLVKFFKEDENVQFYLLYKKQTTGTKIKCYPRSLKGLLVEIFRLIYFHCGWRNPEVTCRMGTEPNNFWIEICYNPYKIPYMIKNNIFNPAEQYGKEILLYWAKEYFELLHGGRVSVDEEKNCFIITIPQ